MHYSYQYQSTKDDLMYKQIAQKDYIKIILKKITKKHLIIIESGRNISLSNYLIKSIFQTFLIFKYSLWSLILILGTCFHFETLG